jgi:hypothetical protein
MERLGWRQWPRKPKSYLRYWPVRALLVLTGWMLACAVGVILWRGALQSMEDEFLLKCQNRKEVTKLLAHSPAHSPARVCFRGLGFRQFSRSASNSRC